MLSCRGIKTTEEINLLAPFCFVNFSMGMLRLIPEVRGTRPNRSAVNVKAVCWCLYHFISSTWSMTSEASFHRTTTWLVWYCACLTLQATANWLIFKSTYIINNDSLLFKQCVPLSALINDFWRLIFSHHSLCLWSFDLQTRFSFVSLVQNGLGAGWPFFCCWYNCLERANASGSFVSPSLLFSMFSVN